MTIAFLINKWKSTLGGGAHAQLRMAQELRKRGHIVSLYHLHRTQKFWYGDARQWRAKTKVDVVICAVGTPDKYLSGNYRVVRVVHSAVNRQWAVGSHVRTDGYIFASRALSDGLDMATIPCVVSWPIIDVDHYRVQPGKHVTLVNPIPEKGGNLFVRVAEMLPEIPFLAVEGGWWKDRQVGKDGPPNLTWMPYQKDGREIYRKTRVLLYPGQWDAGKGWMKGVGMTALEASCAGIPVIASPGDGLIESMGGYATFVPSHDAEDWAYAIKRVYVHDWDECHAKALERADSLSSSQQIDQVEKLLEML